MKGLVKVLAPIAGYLDTGLANRGSGRSCAAANRSVQISILAEFL